MRNTKIMKGCKGGCPFKRALTLVLFCAFINTIHAQSISLAGKWGFQIDRDDAGIQEQWFNKKLSDTTRLPGSMLTNGKGDKVTLNTKWTGSIYDSSWFFNPRMEKYRQPGNLKFPFWLTPEKYYVGAAWYQREIIIPKTWITEHKHIELFLERCHTETTVWVNGMCAVEATATGTPGTFGGGRRIREEPGCSQDFVGQPDVFGRRM